MFKVPSSDLGLAGFVSLAVLSAFQLVSQHRLSSTSYPDLFYLQLSVPGIYNRAPMLDPVGSIASLCLVPVIVIICSCVRSTKVADAMCGSQ